MVTKEKFIIFSHYYFPFFGGIQRFIKSRVDNIEIDKLILITSEPEPKNKYNAKVIFRKFKYSKSSRFLQFTHSIKSIYKELLNVETIQIECSSIYPGGLCVYLLKILFFYKKINLTIYIHGDEFLKAKNSILVYFLYKLIFSKTERIIANSLLTKKIFKEIFKTTPTIKVINPPPSIDFCERITKNKHKIIKKNSKLKIISVCRLVEKKNIKVIIQAVFLLIKKNYKISYQICGSGPELENLKKITNELNLSNFVLFFEDLDDEKLVKKYSESDIFILSTKTNIERNEIEGFGIVFLEALSSGLVVLYPYNSGAKDIRQYSDLCIPIKSNDAQQISENIESAIKKSNNSLLRQNSKKETLDKIAKTYSLLAKKVI